MILLLVDDDALSLHALNRALTLSGFDCLPFETPIAALDYLSSHDCPDMVISDVRMPSLDGVEFAGTLHETHPDLPVILMTAFIEHESLLSCDESSVDGLILKPIRIEELVDMILDIRARRLTQKSKNSYSNRDNRLMGGAHEWN